MVSWEPETPTCPELRERLCYGGSGHADGGAVGGALLDPLGPATGDPKCVQACAHVVCHVRWREAPRAPRVLTSCVHPHTRAPEPPGRRPFILR